jgi:hypothetical protein
MLYVNELGRLCLGIGSGKAPNSKHVAGTNMFFCIGYHNILSHKRREYAIAWLYVKSIQTRTTLTTHKSILGKCICYPGDVGTNTASMELLKLLLNSVLSQKGAHFSSINLKNFYLKMPMPEPEYICIKILDIPNEFINEYKLTGLDCDGWIYFEIHQGCYGLPKQAS